MPYVKINYNGWDTHKVNLMRCLRTFSFLLCLPVAMSAAEREPSIGYVYPAGGRQGSTFEVVIGGSNLNEATTARFSGTGIRATLLKEERQVTPAEQQSLKERLATLQDKRKQGFALTPEEQRSLTDIADTLTKFGRRLANPSLGEFVTLRVTIDPDAPPGEREVRLGVRAGLSNPRVFCVGEFPEFTKPDWKNIPKERGSMDPEKNPAPTAVAIHLPVTLNGQIPPGGVDQYLFQAKTGQRVVMDVRARALIPYLADAVPGWLQATATLRNADGKELAYADDFWFRPDPVIFYQIPADGEYILEVHDALYRGREDFIYRITLGELPFITGLFPLGGMSGGKTNVRLTGWNLADKQVPVDLANRMPGMLSIQPSPRANRVPFAVDRLPELLDQEPNDSLTKAQAVALPIVINGCIDEPGDWDVFRFSGRSGQKIVAEVLARRLDSPLDSLLVLLDQTGQRLALHDDQEDRASGLNTHHADSHLAITLPADGIYHLGIGDTQHGGGQTYAYRLRIDAPQPDFELRVTPSAINIRGGASAILTVYALRKDGFDGDISLSLRDAPASFTLSGALIPANADQVTCTLSAPALAFDGPVTLHLDGKAMIAEREVVRPAVPADDMTQAFAYHHLVPAQEWIVSVVGRFRPGDETIALARAPLRIPAGGTVSVPVRVPAGPQIANLTYEILSPPAGFRIGAANRTSWVIEAVAGEIKPGQRGNLIVGIYGARAAQATGSTGPIDQRRIPLGAFPAIPYEIINP